MRRALYVPEPLLRRMVLAELDGSVDEWLHSFSVGTCVLSRGLRATAEAVLGSALKEAFDWSANGIIYPRITLPGPPSVYHLLDGQILYDRCREAPRRNRNLGVFHRVWRAVRLLEAYVQLQRQHTGAT